MRPGSITSLRHAWTHPAFIDDTPVDPAKVNRLTPAVRESREWLENFATRFGVDTDELIEAARTGDCGDICGNDDSFGEECREQAFWNHIAVVTGQDYDDDHRENTYFRCAC